MQVEIVGRHVEVTEAIEDHIKKRLQKIKKYFPQKMDVHVILFTQRFLQCADITIQTSGLTIHGEEKSKDLYASIDAVISKLEKQIKKHKDRLVRHHQKPKENEKDKNLNLNISVYERDLFETFEERDDLLPTIHTNKVTVKPMQIEEAVLQMDLNNQDFMVFLEDPSQKIKVLYRRNDGDYGLIEPEY
jgi:putative sigma-54 modulation protein